MRYPKQLELYHNNTSLECDRVYFPKPKNPLVFASREMMMDVVNFDTSSFYSIDPDKPGMLVTHDAFAFVDNRNRVVEYILSKPITLSACTESIYEPVTLEELQTAIIELETISAVADMYCTSTASVMTRIQNHNLYDKLNPLIPSKEYLQIQETNVAHGDVHLSYLAHQWGVDTAVMALWLSEYT